MDNQAFKKPALAIITVNFENYAVSHEFLNSLKKQTKQDFKIYLVDLSKNKQEIESQPFLEVVTAENKGYAHGINVGLKKAVTDGSERFAVINNDTEVTKDFVENAVRSIDEHPSAIIGGKIYYYPGFEYHKNRYEKKESGKVIWYAGGAIDWGNAIAKHRGVDEADRGQYEKREETEFITGCLMGFDKSVIDKVGMWDESYFLYFEDADWCERAKRNGVKLFYDPQVVIYHKNAQSTGGSGSKLHEDYQKKNRLKFGLRYAPLRTKLHLLKEVIFG